MIVDVWGRGKRKGAKKDVESNCPSGTRFINTVAADRKHNFGNQRKKNQPFQTKPDIYS